MKPLSALILLLTGVWSSCSLGHRITDHIGIGARDERGRASGNWKLYAKQDNSIFAEGAYLDGKPHGLWKLWDESGTRNAHIDFEHGRYNGPYLLFYSGHTPTARGRLKTKGETLDNHYNGDFIRYDSKGKVHVNYSVFQDQVSTVQAGLKVDAQHQIEADAALLKVYKEAILYTPSQ